jgi:hypothetical protein
MLKASLLLAVGVLSGCASNKSSNKDVPPMSAPTKPASPSTSQPTAPMPSPMDGDIEWRLTASSQQITMAERGHWRLRVSATNRGTVAAEIGSPASEFSFDGAPSMGLNLTYSNGVLEPGWDSLPPGETASTEREVGDTLFAQPGRHEIVLRHGRATSALVVDVMP